MFKWGSERKKLIRYFMLVILGGHLITSFLIPFVLFYPNFNLEIYFLYSKYYIIALLLITFVFILFKMVEEFQGSKKKNDDWE